MLNEEISIREYTGKDFNEIMKVAKALPEWFTEGGVKNIAVDILFQKGFVAIYDDTVVGFISFFVSEAAGHIGWMGIVPSYHRKGMGKKLLEKLFSELKAKGVKEVLVNTLGDSVEYEPYEKTRIFYRSAGFTDFERIKQDNPECEELLILRKKL